MKAAASILVDSHVHYHACFSWTCFLESAARNFDSTRRSLQLDTGSPGCLVLTETAGAAAFDRLAAQTQAAGWRVEPTDEAGSILLRRDGEALLMALAGRQVVTSERLEVLAVGRRREVADGRPIRDVVREVTAGGCLAVIPWGFGKWLGSRGRIVRQLLEEDWNGLLCLGDNGGRPHAAARPGLFHEAETRGTPVLAGSDPLPLPWQVRRVGSYGFVLNDWRPTSRPLETITARIRTSRQSPPVFGNLSSIAAVVRSQVGIRLAAS